MLFGHDFIKGHTIFKKKFIITKASISVSIFVENCGIYQRGDKVIGIE